MDMQIYLSFYTGNVNAYDYLEMLISPCNYVLYCMLFEEG